MTEETESNLKLSPQAVGAIMMAVQNAMMAAAMDRPSEECDAHSVIKNFELRNTQSGLQVLNPPVLKIDYLKEEPEEEEQ